MAVRIVRLSVRRSSVHGIRRFGMGIETVRGANRHRRDPDEQHRPGDEAQKQFQSWLVPLHFSNLYATRQ